MTAAAFVGAVQTVVSRNMDPFAATLVSVTHIEGGYNWNVIPDETFVEGTTRSMSKEGRQAIRNRIETLAASTAAAYEARAEVQWIPGPPALINDAHWGILARKVAEKQGFDKQPMAPSLGGEDFAFYYDYVYRDVYLGGIYMKWKTWKKFGVIAMAVIMGAAFLAGCGSDNSSSSSANKKELTYSKSQGPYSDLFEKGIKPILEKKGYKVTGKDMSDLLQADVALNEGEVDFNVEQHTAYMENFNQKQNGHLAAITPIPTVPAGIFPGAKTSLDQVADGDTIAVPNDASNTARAYALLRKIGWIKLDPNKDLSTVTQQDIVENPHHLKFTEMESLTIPSVRSDFSYIVITGAIIYNAKIDSQTALAKEDILPHLLLQLVVQDKDKDAQWVKDIADAYHSDEFKEYMKKNNNGLWFVPNGE